MRNVIFLAACLPLLPSRDGGIANNARAFVPPHASSSSSSSSSSSRRRPVTSRSIISTSSSSRSARRGGGGDDDRATTRWRRTSRTAVVVAVVAAVEGGGGGGGEISPEDHDLLPAEEEGEGEDADEDVVAGRAGGGGGGGGGDDETTTDDLKRRLLAIAASYDRGFGATPAARREADDIVRRLEAMNPTKENASRGIDGRDDDIDDVPLRAVWRMVWTSAFDVISLGGSPFAAPSAIYQDIRDPPNAINVIDFIPRAQALMPSSMSPHSLLRAKVSTRASSRPGNSNRVGLSFVGLELQPIELFGRRVDGLPPLLSVDFAWPGSVLRRLVALVPGLAALGGWRSGDAGEANVDAPGYFDVVYLDEELLIIRQQAPGGVFALVKVDSCDP